MVKEKTTPVDEGEETTQTAPGPSGMPEPKMVTIPAEELQRIQDQLKMLYAVADQGRVFNYENQRAGQKKPLRVKLSVYQDCLVIGWRTIKDELVKHPTTGLTVGEVQQYELLLRAKDGSVKKTIVDGYKQFSDIHYSERIECEVQGKKEDWDGKLTFDIKLPDGTVLPLDARFVN